LSDVVDGADVKTCRDAREKETKREFIRNEGLNL